jgi:hypothetical protein
VLAIAAASLFVVPLDAADRFASLGALILMTVLALRTVRRGGPLDARDYLLGVCVGLALAAIAAALSVVHLTDDGGVAAVIWACAAIAFAGVTMWGARLALLVTRLPQLVGSDEESRAFAVGTAEFDGRQKRVAVMVTDKRVIVATPHGGRPRLALQRSLARLGEIDVHPTDGVAEIELQVDVTSLVVRRVPLGQVRRLPGALGRTTG